MMFAFFQLIPVENSNPPIESEISTSPEVRSILHRACYDCHSNETTWAWLSKGAPTSWLITADVHESRKELKESWEEISENEMRPRSYLLMHRSAALSGEEREILHKWIVDLTVQQKHLFAGVNHYARHSYRDSSGS